MPSFSDTAPIVILVSAMTSRAPASLQDDPATPYAGIASRWKPNTPELARLIMTAQDQGWSLHEIVDAIEADVDGMVALNAAAQGNSQPG